MLAGLAREKCLIYLDDILVIGRTFKEHIHNLKEVFGRLPGAGLRLKPSKCRLARETVDFLGYTVSRNGISADPNKVSTVANYPTPVDLKSLRSSFLSIANPLYTLTRKGTPFVWTQESDVAFEGLKRKLIQHLC